MIEVFTDGACSVNPGVGGWAYIIKKDGKELSTGVGAKPNTTNNQMEMQAVISGISEVQALKSKEILDADEAVTLTSDSLYVIKGITEWIHNWKRNNWQTSGGKPVKNKELWKKLDKLNNKLITYKHIKGHSGHIENEKCDKLAVTAYKHFKEAK